MLTRVSFHESQESFYNFHSFKNLTFPTTFLKTIFRFMYHFYMWKKAGHHKNAPLDSIEDLLKIKP